MPRLSPKIYFKPTSHKSVAQFRFPFNWHTIAHLKQFPGCRYEPKLGKGTWLCAEEMIPIVFKHFKKRGFQLVDQLPKQKGVCADANAIHELARPFQQKLIQFMLEHPRVINSSEMGLGKTFTAIETIRLSNTEQALIVCPAVVRQQWVDQLDQWWPDHPECQIITTGAEAATEARAPFIIISYELLKKLSCEPTSFDAMVLDESHYVKNGLAGRTKDVHDYARRLRPDCRRIALTATPIDKPEDLWAQLHFLYPHRYGTFWQFVSAYCELEENEYAPNRPDIVGVNEHRMGELRARLDILMRRVTKQEVADQLPPCLTQTIRVKAPRTLNVKELTARFARRDLHKGQLDELVAKASSAKPKAIVEYVENLFKGTTHHVVIFTHLRKTTENLAAALGKKLPKDICIRFVHGKDPSAKRHRPIKEAEKAKRAVLVATTASTGLGLNLQAFPECIFGEISYSLTQMEQAAGRPHRLSSTEPVQLTFFVLQGSHEEAIASRVRDKIETNSKIIDKTAAIDHVERGLTEKMSDEDFLSEIRDVAASMLEGDEYCG